MIVVPTLESTLARRWDAILNLLLRGLYLETGSTKTFPTERDRRATRRDLIKSVGSKYLGMTTLIFLSMELTSRAKRSARLKFLSGIPSAMAVRHSSK